MKKYLYPGREEWETILGRPQYSLADLHEKVRGIIDRVKVEGDRALVHFTHQFDGVELPDFAVSANEIAAAGGRIPEELKASIQLASRNIEKFHALQMVEKDVYVETAPGVRCWQRTVPVQKVGLYVPGGTAPLLSTLLMLGIPAKLAGCREIVLCTPPGKDGKISDAILYIAGLLSIEMVFAVGGAQAIAAMAYGTETVPRVNKIFGPGNQYVQAAKQLVSMDSVAIDMPAGPSELAVMADQTAVPAFVASDLLSQAEHGPDSQVILVSNSMTVLDEVEKEIGLQLSKLPRRDIAEKALEYSRLILVEDQSQMIELVNYYAPEHLIIACAGAVELSDQVLNAGSVFLGNFSPESAGDYASGTNHTLPTSGWAHACSGLNMDAYVKKITFQEISREGLIRIGSAIMVMAEAEKLAGHSNAVDIRLNYKL